SSFSTRFTSSIFLSDLIANRYFPLLSDKSNVKLPYNDGNWLIKQIRGHSSSLIRQLPAIAITSYTREVSSHKALNAGFDRFLTKLESPEEIVSEIVNLLSARLFSLTSQK
ncbi:response regulator, partial [Nostoc sp.]|uniref:response regulator n=1 Tax=Nostoc sp. TaxID=1180 RepID=UPI003B5E65ED